MRTPVFALVAFVLAGCGAASTVDVPIEAVVDAPSETASASASAAASAGPAGAACTRDEPCAMTGTQVAASLDATSPTDAGGRYEASYAFALQAGQTARVYVTSSDFNTTLAVEGHGVSLQNDDFFAGSLDSLIQFQAPETGSYVVRVSAYAPAAGGAFKLSAEPYAPENVAPAFVLGESATGELQPGGMGLGTGERAGDMMWFEARAGQRMTVRVTSGDFDTVATLIGPSGETWFNDDAQDTGPDGTESALDSTIEAMAPRDGWYQLLVAPYGAAGEGIYTVRSSYREPLMVGANGFTPDEGYAGPDQAGRVLGLFIGITAYGDSPLYGCADDATFLAQAFAERGLIAPEDTEVLTDAQATNANVIVALARLAERAGPEDFVVIFYSGHGSVQSAPDEALELDGTDETLVFVDGDMTDTRFVGYLDAIDAGTLMLALDACQSGGFARDFMTRPGRIGLFSSDEDVLSATAEPVGAGGYLSYALRQAVLGHGDNRPGDGAMLAGELTDYLIESFVEEHRNMNPAGSSLPLQRVIIERGSVGWSDTLWLYPRRPEGGFVGDPETCYHSGPTTVVEGQGGSCR